MSNQKIIIKNSTGSTTPSLQYGELAIKYLNGSEALYTKNSSNQIIAFNDWAKILNKPTTLSGYGITDAIVKDGDVIMNTNPFGGRPLYINSIDNAMFAADKKWYVTVTTHLRTYNSETYPKLNPSWVESYTVTGSGTAFNVAGSPTSIVVYNNDTLCSEVTTPTTQNQYKYVGGVLTFGATVTGTIRVYPGYDVKQYIDSPVANTLSGANAFDGSYETTIGVSTGYYMKINIKFNESGTAGFSGGYPYGRYFLSYYYTSTSEKAEYRVYNRTYRPHIIGWKKYDFTDFKGTNANANHIQSFYDGGNYGRSEIEFIVYGHDSHSTGLSQIDLKLDRPNLSVNGSTFTKYGNNKLYYDIYLGNQTSNNISLYQNGNINASGTITASSFVGNASSATKLANTRTIWGQNFDGTGNVTGRFNLDGLDNSQFSIYNNGTSKEIQTYGGHLSINPGGANVLVGTRTDSGYKLDVNGTARISNDLTLSGNLNLNTSANQINSTSAVELALNYAGGGARHTSIFDGQGNFIMRAHANGNVGIGTSEPQYKLDVNGSVRTGTIIIDEHVSDAGLKINNNSNTYSRIRFFDSDNNVGTIHAFTGNAFLFNNQKCINIDSMGAVSLGHWNEPNVYINTVNGCVGISNTNPQFKLDVNGASRIFGSLHLNNEGWLNLYNGANTSTISLSHNNASSKLDIYNRTLGNWANVEAGFLTCDTITMKNNLSEKFIRSNAWGGAIRLRANSGAATDRGLQLGRVDNNLSFTSFMAFNGDSGNVSIASTLDNGYKLDVNGSGHYASELFLDYGLRISNAAGSGEGISLFAESSTNPNYGLMFARTIYKGTHGAVNGDWATYFTMSPDAGRGWIFTNSASSTNGNVASISNTGNFTASGEVTAYSASDIRLKTNIKPICSAIDVINKLNPVTYNWNEKAKELNPLKTDSTEYGLIAQELEVVMPELVHTIYDKYKSIDYVKLVPILIKGMQELKAEINELKNK